MSGASRWLSQGRRLRWTGLSYAAGAATFVGASALRDHQIFHADSASSVKDWASRQTVVSSHAQGFSSSSDVRSKVAENTERAKKYVAPETKGIPPDGEASAWQQATDKIADVNQGFTGAKLTDMIMPNWFKMLPGYITKLQNELSMAPWSLGWEIWEEAHDPEINPEILWEADVRISNDLCKEEQAFLGKRKVNTAKALAKYLDIPEKDVHPEDVPIIAMCGSGGGLRALVAGTSSYFSTQRAGLFDCVTYTAGVSGSCWLQTLYLSSIGQQSHEIMLEHFKQRLGVHICFPPAALSLLSQAPTNKFLLSGMVEKLRGVPDADFGIVDIYGLLLAARLLVPKGELRVSDYDLKISNQRHYTDKGQQPLPIYTAVRHEMPLNEGGMSEASEKARKDAISEAWFQWFEWTPYEFFCEEFQTGIPTWAVGRRFDKGQSVKRQNEMFLPELRVPLMMGIWGSAFCATLAHYYKEIRPIVKSAGLGSLDGLMAEKDDDMIKVHPIDPSSIPNFALGLKDKLPSTCPESLHSATHLRLMDAGMSNNLPIYPLLRPGRDVDVIIAFDASADVRTDNWIKVADGYARQRGIKGWPLGAGWPPQSNTEGMTSKELDEAQASTAKEASKKLKKAQKQDQDDSDLGFCTVWVGSKEEREASSEPPPTKRLSPEGDDWRVTSPNAGLALIYFPLLPNPKVPGVDPATSDFMSTWNFIYKPDDIDSVVALAKANFEEGEAQTKRTIRAVWERKRDQRLELEKDERELRRRLRLRSGQPIGKKGSGDHGDHFS
ncbi:FabD/lysophospholipase-like protein [Polychaeton citri CBS 116435]|uniref:Lysophospholipase n=1 Tax=Polychaeton citri CBS 116435 TaxID=1314669 RepID=A0A9P4USB1_9PEZI|nr:FabD/lysophospholipase-like protein [Polychaeton citri CBS 116435]